MSLSQLSLNKTSIKPSRRFYNESGKIRLNHVRAEFENMRTLSHEELLSIYQEWRDSDEFVVLANVESRKFLAVKCAKRGNDVYRWRIENRFKALDSLSEQIGDIRIFSIGDERPTTNVLFLTLTFDTKLCDESTAWNRIGEDWNRQIAYLEKKFGKVSFMRAWEGFKNGYPHIHAVVVFEEHDFEVIEHWDTENKSTYRIKEKEGVKGTYHSYVDVVAVNSVGGSIRYLTKYLRKTHGRGSGVNLTQAQMWLHRNQSFSMSDDFLERLRLVYKTLHNSKSKQVQSTLNGDIIEVIWQFVGIFSRKDLEHLVKDRGKFEHAWTSHLSSLNGLTVKERRR